MQNTQSGEAIEPELQSAFNHQTSFSKATMPRSAESHPPDVSVKPDNFSIAIVGGGIGGLSTALSLAAYSPLLSANNVTVYEQAPTYSEIGAGIAIGIQAARVLQQLGVWEAADAISGHRSNIHRSNRRWDNDELIGDAPAAESDGKIRQMWLHRAELLEVLYNEIERRRCARLTSNKKVVRLEVCSDICCSSSATYPSWNSIISLLLSLSFHSCLVLMLLFA